MTILISMKTIRNDAPDPGDADMLMEEVEQFLRDQDK